MSENTTQTFLCIASFFKGEAFLRACKEAGNTVFLVTSKKLENEAWPKDHIDSTFYLEEDASGNWNMNHLIEGLAHQMQENAIDRVVALDDFDVEKAAQIREHFRIPGMGQTTSRHFRDKLAMRVKAAEAGISIPAFSTLFNNNAINKFAKKTKGPWVVKPRAEASATGIQKVDNLDDLWKAIHNLGDKRHEYLVEQFKPGDVYHADSLIVEGKVVFCRVSKYMNTPFEVAHGGGIFRSHTIPFGSKDDRAIQKMNKEVMKAFGMQYSATHTEFIKCHDDGKIYFLETASRVGGAHLAEMVEASSGINLWAEWAKLESAMAKNISYKAPKATKEHTGIVVSLSRFQHPDTSSFTDEEIWWRLKKEYHIGLIVKSKKHDRIKNLLDEYAHRIQHEFHASAPAQAATKTIN